MARNLFLMVVVILITLIVTSLPSSEAIAGNGGNGNGNGQGKTTGWYSMRAEIELVNRQRSIHGKAAYNERMFKGETEKRLRVHMRNGPALRIQSVRFNGEIIGIFMTDLFGDGHFFMGTHRTTGQWNTMPEDFPTVITGDEISAGRARGNFEIHPSNQ